MRITITATSKSIQLAFDSTEEKQLFITYLTQLKLNTEFQQDLHEYFNVTEVGNTVTLNNEIAGINQTIHYFFTMLQRPTPKYENLRRHVTPPLTSEPNRLNLDGQKKADIPDSLITLMRQYREASHGSQHPRFFQQSVPQTAPTPSIDKTPVFDVALAKALYKQHVTFYSRQADRIFGPDNKLRNPTEVLQDLDKRKAHKGASAATLVDIKNGRAAMPPNLTFDIASARQTYLQQSPKSCLGFFTRIVDKIFGSPKQPKTCAEVWRNLQLRKRTDHAADATLNAIQPQKPPTLTA